MTEWIDLVKEETLEPKLPICDPHHHLWDTQAQCYLLNQFLQDANSGHNVVSTVFVECSSMYRQDGPDALKPIGETEFVQGIAAMSDSGGYGTTRVAAGIVSFANLLMGEAVKPVLEAHIAASPNRFRGIRHAAGWDPSPAVRNSHSNPPRHLYMRDEFRRGFALLQPLQLSFDAWFYHTQLDDFIDLAKTFPETTIILNHLGGPLGIGPYAGCRQEIFAYWQERIETLGNYPNVYLKLGGINMKVNGFEWHTRERPASSEELAEATSAYYDHAIKHFGASRCMFESNFPVDKASCSYNVLWNTFKKISQDYSADERNALFCDTATRVYRLDCPAVPGDLLQTQKSNTPEK